MIFPLKQAEQAQLPANALPSDAPLETFRYDAPNQIEFKGRPSIAIDSQKAPSSRNLVRAPDFDRRGRRESRHHPSFATMKPPRLPKRSDDSNNQRKMRAEDAYRDSMNLRETCRYVSTRSH